MEMDNRRQVELKTLIKLKEKENNMNLLQNYFVVFILYVTFYFWLRNMCVAVKIARGGGQWVWEGLGMA